MKIARAKEEQPHTMPAPFDRTITIMMAPDRHDVPEIMLSHVIIPPGSGTDYHAHDRPELIYVAQGKGVARCEGEEIDLEPDLAMWILEGEMHEVRNTGDEDIKLMTVFVPGYSAEESYQAFAERARENAEGK